MKSLNKTLAAAALGATLAVSGAAFADDNAPQLTPEEQGVVSLVHEFQDCINGKLEVIPQSEVQQTVDKLLEKGVPNNPYVIQKYLSEIYVKPAQDACISEMNIDVKDVAAKVNALVNKYGKEVLDRAPAADPAPAP